MSNDLETVVKTDWVRADNLFGVEEVGTAGEDSISSRLEHKAKQLSRGPAMINAARKEIPASVFVQREEYRAKRACVIS